MVEPRSEQNKSAGKRKSFARRFIDACRQIVRNEFLAFVGALRDGWFYVLLALGAAAWFLPPTTTSLGLGALALRAVIEEFAFRAGLQEFLNSILRGRRLIGPLTAANVLASALFAGLHLTSQPWPWALATFFPGLVFGLSWDRYGSLTANSAVHFWYNACLLYVRQWIVF